MELKEEKNSDVRKKTGRNDCQNKTKQKRIIMERMTMTSQEKKFSGFRFAGHKNRKKMMGCIPLCVCV